MEIESYIESFQELEDIPLKRLSFDEMVEMDDHPDEFGPFAAYLLSRRTLPPAFRQDDLQDEEIKEWLIEIVSNFLESKEAS